MSSEQLDYHISVNQVHDNREITHDEIGHS